MWRKHRCSDYVLFEEPKPALTPQYVCAGCKCLMEKPVKFVEHIIISTKTLDAYCGKCAPPYDKVDEFHGHYLKMLRVNLDGTLWVEPDAKKSK